MHRRLALSIFALSLGSIACNGAGATADDSDTTGGPGSTSAPTPGTGTDGDDGTCYPGYETCPCLDGELCLDGLQCLSGLCVEIPALASTGEVGSENGESSTAPVDDDTSTGEPAETSTSSGSSSEESSTTELEPVCFDGDTFCEEDETDILICIDGQWLEQTCDESCLTTGHTGTDCAANQQECVCDGFSDADCELDVEVLCYCYFDDLLGSECTDDQREEFYQWCYQDTDPVVACFGSYYDPEVGLDCDAAISNCL